MKKLSSAKVISFVTAEFVNLDNFVINEHFAHNLAEKIEIEKQKQDETLNLLKTEFLESQDRYLSGSLVLTRVLGKKQHSLLARSFVCIEDNNRDNNADNTSSNTQQAPTSIVATREKQIRHSFPGVLENIK